MVEKPIFSICASDEFFKSLHRITMFKSTLRLNRLTIQYHIRRVAPSFAQLDFLTYQENDLIL